MNNLELNALLTRVDDQSVAAGVSRVFLEVRDTGEDREVRVRANREGLVHLATHLVRLAVSDSPGAHLHVDESTFADHCDRNLVVTLAEAPWK